MITKAAFGRTGHDSSRIIFGGAGLFSKAWGQEWAEQQLEAALAAGINHIDTAASYGDSEEMLGPWLHTTVDGVRNRDRVFLATKTGERSGDAARAELERSLERMGVDSVDLLQLHNLVEDDEWEQTHGPGGVLEAMTAARDEGLVSHIGVTGHGVRIAGMHLRSLDAFDYASVLLPINPSMLDRPDYRADVEALRERCVERGVAMQTIKAIARRRWVPGESDVDEKRSWYQPLREAAPIERAMRYVLAEEQYFLNTSSDLRLLPLILDAANTIFGSASIEWPDPEELRADTDAFGMTALFDGADLERI